MRRSVDTMDLQHSGLSHGFATNATRGRREFAGPAAPPVLRAVDRTLWPALALLAGLTVLFELSDYDLLLQDLFYDFEHAKWLVDSRAGFLRALFHELPTIITVAIGLGLILQLASSKARALGERFFVATSRARWCAVATIASVPAFVAMGKEVTNMFCPYEIQRYGGDVCYVQLFEEAPPANEGRQGNCFPAGHASGPFALLGLVSLMRRRKQQVAAIGFALALGWIAGGYQILTGGHYVSHTIETMLMAWIALILWRRAFGLTAAGNGLHRGHGALRNHASVGRGWRIRGTA